METKKNYKKPEFKEVKMELLSAQASSESLSL